MWCGTQKKRQISLLVDPATSLIPIIPHAQTTALYFLFINTDVDTDTAGRDRSELKNCHVGKTSITEIILLEYCTASAPLPLYLLPCSFLYYFCFCKIWVTSRSKPSHHDHDWSGEGLNGWIFNHKDTPCTTIFMRTFINVICFPTLYP